MMDEQFKKTWFSAAQLGDVGLLDRLSHHLIGNDINVIDARKRTALHVACAYRQVNAVSFLIEKGVDLNHEDMHGQTPLITAIINKDERSLEILLKAGAEPLHFNSKDDNAFYVVLEDEHYSHSLINILLKESGIDMAGKDGVDLLLQACSNENIEAIEQFINHGANINAEVEYSITKGGEKSIKKHPAWFEIAMIWRSNIGFFDKILEYEPDLALKNYQGQTILEWGQDNANDQFIEYFREKMAVYESKVLEKAIDIDARLESGLKF